MNARRVRLAVVTLAAITLALIETRPLGWRDPRIVAAIVVGAAGLPWFVLHIRRSPTPLPARRAPS